MNERALPAGEMDGLFGVVFDGSEQGSDFGRLKFCDGGRQRGFVGAADSAPQLGSEVIDRLRTEVDQVAASGLKCLEKVFVGDLEYFTHGSVKA